ncbi:hypothetical protein MPC4_170015 [Methylocella tundrae]|uniref:Uncharacterized protein n=1 Tax=Methylocella tundrae TaxID=227605 RepID=A0A8B6M3W8_METTU|nr:hypothetical protein [Methylocella tundrae]VTZ27851.1 hypothetical protein MPC1_6860002 [Methylocella tundrae]VTZ49484.1 hypothetical protein MPC4_170015 [Methylocella tundrae]
MPIAHLLTAAIAVVVFAAFTIPVLLRLAMWPAPSQGPAARRKSEALAIFEFLSPERQQEIREEWKRARYEAGEWPQDDPIRQAHTLHGRIVQIDARVLSEEMSEPLRYQLGKERAELLKRLRVIEEELEEAMPPAPLSVSAHRCEARQ